MRRIKIMAHLVAGFPSPEGWKAAAAALRNAGVEILEIQIPFSDPTADGPDITAASEASLRQGFRVRDIFSCIAFGRELGFEEIHVMTYANIVHRYGMEQYIRDMADSKVTGLIVPDYPIEDDHGFYRTAAGYPLAAMPVAVPTMNSTRLRMLADLKPVCVYAALRQGVTGRKTEIDGETFGFLEKLSEMRVYAGFGISHRDQLKALESRAYAAVIGSHITRAASRSSSPEEVYREVDAAIHQCAY